MESWRRKIILGPEMIIKMNGEAPRSAMRRNVAHLEQVWMTLGMLVGTKLGTVTLFIFFRPTDLFAY
jgi:hypothetical protein